MTNRPGFYEFFCCGGMARAGFGEAWRCLFANDIDAKKARSYAANWGDEALRIAPNPAAFVNRGGTYFGKGDIDRAFADYAEALRLDPESVSALYSRGMLTFITGKNDRGIADFDQAIHVVFEFVFNRQNNPAL